MVRLLFLGLFYGNYMFVLSIVLLVIVFWVFFSFGFVIRLYVVKGLFLLVILFVMKNLVYFFMSGMMLMCVFLI